MSIAERPGPHQRPRQRITVSNADLIVAPDADEIAGYAPANIGEAVAPLPPSAADRAAGRRRLEVIVDGWRFEVTLEPAARAELRERASRAAADHLTTADITLRAQIPGRVSRVWVAVGEQVEAGQRLLAIEAMKMENELRAPRAGTVKLLRVEVGARVERQSELLTIG